MQQIGCFLVSFEVVARWSLIRQVGAGNFGSHEKKGAEIPKRPADKIIVEQTSEDQAALYRVGSGDMSLLHIDPRVAAMSDLWSLVHHISVSEFRLQCAHFAWTMYDEICSSTCDQGVCEQWRYLLQGYQGGLQVKFNWLYVLPGTLYLSGYSRPDLGDAYVGRGRQSRTASLVRIAS